MNLPKGIAHSIEHNQHHVYYETVEQHLHVRPGELGPTITPEDLAECIRTDELWTLHWYPATPIGFWWVAAPTLELLLERAANIADGTR